MSKARTSKARTINEDILIEEWQLPARSLGYREDPPRLQVWRDSTGFAVYIIWRDRSPGAEDPEASDDYGFATLDQAMQFAAGWMEGYSWNTGTKGYPSRISRIGME